MAGQTADQQIRALVDAFVADLSGLVRQSALEAVHDVLGGSAPAPAAPKRQSSAPKRAASAPKKPKGGKRIRRSPEDLQAMADTVQAHVRQNPGQGIEQISRELGIPSAELKHPVSLLLSSNALRTEGQRRGTKYFAAAGGPRKSSAKKAPAKKKASKKRTAKKKASKKAA